jgi:MFS family permease
MTLRTPPEGRQSEPFGSRGTLAPSVALGALGGLVFGYDLGGLSAASDSIRSFFHLGAGQFGLTISSSLWGTVLGSVLMGWQTDRFQRRWSIAGAALLYSLAALALLLPLSAHWLFLISMRFLNGMAVGGFTVACPLYLSEIAPSAQRGRIVGLFQLLVGVGVVVAFSAGILFGSGPNAWRWILAAGALPALLTLVFAPCLPQRATILPPPRSQIQSHAQMWRLLRQNWKMFLIATSIALFNQLSGVNVLLLYMLEILSSGGVNLTLGHRYALIISCLGIAVTCVSLTFIDRIGRKPLLYAGSLGMAFCLLLLGVAIPHHVQPSFYVGILVAYNALFAFSQGSVVWVYLSELFPPGIRGIGQGYGATVHWLANAALITIFPRVEHGSSGVPFFGFAGLMLLQVFVVRFWYPERSGTELDSVFS